MITSNKPREPQEINQCPFCGHEIITEERPITNYTDYDPPCYFAKCKRPSLDSTTVKTGGFLITLYACPLHSQVMMNLAERMQQGA